MLKNLKASRENLALGKEIQMLVDSRQAAGLRQVAWDGAQESPPGVYIYRIQVKNKIDSGKIIRS